MKTRILALVMAVAMIMSCMTIVASADEHPDTWFSEETVTLSIMRDENPSQTIDPNSLKVQTVLELLNIQLDVQTPPKDSYKDKSSVLIATDDMPDIMFITRAQVEQYARDDMFVNLSEHRDQLPDLFARLDANPSFSMLTIDGSFYHVLTINRPSVYDAAVSGQFPVIRTDLLAELGLAVPTSFDELYDVLKAFKAAYPDCIPLTNRKGGSTTATRKVMDTMAYPLGSGSTMYYDEDMGGKWVYGPANENFKAVLAYLNKLYAEGLLDPDYASMTVDLWKEKMSSGKALMYFDNSGFASQFNAGLVTINPNYNLAAIPTLTNTIGETRNRRYSNDKTDEAWVISASTDKLDACLYFLNWCFTDQGADVNGYGKEGVSFEMVDGHPSIKDEVLAQYAASPATAYYDLQSGLGVGLLDIAPYSDFGAQYQMEQYLMDEETLATYMANAAVLNSDTALRAEVLNPPMSSEETERYNELKLKVEDYCYSQMDAFISGERPIDEYDAVIAQAQAYGSTEMEEIFNNAWKRALGE